MDAPQPVAMPRRQERRRAVGAVDVQPQAARLAEASDGLDVVERAGRRRARGRDDRHHLPAGGAQGIEGACQGVHVHVVVARRHDDGVLGADAELADGPRHAVVRVFAADHHRRVRADALPPRVGPRSLPRGEQPREGRLGAAGRERAARLRTVAGKGAHPAHDLRFDDRADWRHFPHGAGLVEGGSERLGPHRNGQGRRHLVPHRARVRQAVAVGQNVVPQAIEDIAERPAQLRQRLGEARRQLRGREGRRDPPGSRPRICEVLCDQPRHCRGGLGACLVFQIGQQLLE